ncbi:MAG TPA: heparan-alpha-glucosaminide N-acetyltransferase domain-containing protein [Solidesulfovibrio magneticus]|nr:heparan-alpha-glucosaminide N-acetyltransferase domain-containing protein [Solidesulfovibrio magneticus]
MPSPATSRLPSVDALRGLAIAAMIVVNNPGDRRFVYPQLLHAHWHGLTLADVVFPLFLFLVGVCVALAINPDKARDAKGRFSLWRKILPRAAVLFALGLGENAYLRLSFEALRIPGVLQRIAVVYLAAAWLQSRLSSRSLAVVASATLLGYWLLLAAVPVPGHGHPSLAMEPNLQGWLDQLVLGRHIWKFGTTWDPEGVLSTLPAIALGFIGVLAGRWLRRGSARPGRAGLFGLLMAAIGLAWNAVFPFNKSLCTSSFVLFTGGLGLLLLAVAHAVLDGRPPAAWARPLCILGRNPLFLYVTASFLAASLRHIRVLGATGQPLSLQKAIYFDVFHFLPPGPFPSLCWGLLMLAVMFLLALALHARGIAIRL